MVTGVGLGEGSACECTAFPAKAYPSLGPLNKLSLAVSHCLVFLFPVTLVYVWISGWQEAQMSLAHMLSGSGTGKCYLALNLSSQMLRLFLCGGLPLLQLVVLFSILTQWISSSQCSFLAAVKHGEAGSGCSQMSRRGLAENYFCMQHKHTSAPPGRRSRLLAKM